MEQAFDCSGHCEAAAQHRSLWQRMTQGYCKAVDGCRKCNRHCSRAGWECDISASFPYRQARQLQHTLSRAHLFHRFSLTGELFRAGKIENSPPQQCSCDASQVAWTCAPSQQNPTCAPCVNTAKEINAASEQTLEGFCETCP